MGMVLRFAPRLPNALVGLVPILGYVISEADQYLLHFAVQRAAVKGELRGRVNYLAINVQLELVSRGISNADWPRVRGIRSSNSIAAPTGALSPYNEYRILS